MRAADGDLLINESEIWSLCEEGVNEGEEDFMRVSPSIGVDKKGRLACRLYVGSNADYVTIDLEDHTISVAGNGDDEEKAAWAGFALRILNVALK